jgi:hypothetical protein
MSSASLNAPAFKLGIDSPTTVITLYSLTALVNRTCKIEYVLP